MNDNNTAARRKLIQEVVVLVVVVLLILVAVSFQSGFWKQQPKNTAATTSTLNPNFDTNALNEVKDRSGTVPDVQPQPGDLGKDNPFAP